jgi:hypothetical protein
MLRARCHPVVCEDMVGSLPTMMRPEIFARCRIALQHRRTLGPTVLVRGSRSLALREHRQRHRGISLHDGRLSVRVGLLLRFHRLCGTKCRVPVVRLVKLAQPGILSSWTGRQQIGRLRSVLSIVVRGHCKDRSTTWSICRRQAARLP